MKKMIAIALALMLCIGALSVVASAASEDYYLFGYINGVDYGCNDDWENLGEYKFVNGELTVTFDSDSYIAVKTGDNANWFMTQAYVTDTTGTFINTSTGTAEKMFVPGGVELTFTLVENADGSLTVSYSTDGNGGDPAPAPTPTPTYDAYYVTGNTEWLGSWAADNASGLMTEGTDGIWTKTYENVAAGSYSLKVTVGNWDASWGGDGEFGNYDLTVAEDGAEIVVKFNPDTQKVTVLINGENANPGTGDLGIAGVSIALLAATAGLVAVVSKKKEF